VLKGKDGCEIKVYQGQVHGFAVRGDHTVEKERKAKESCAQNVLYYSQFLGSNLMVDSRVSGEIFKIT
jgi:hypothetical protein